MGVGELFNNRSGKFFARSIAKHFEHLGSDRYIHSSGKDQGRNGIDELSDRGDAVSRTYYAQMRGAGRVVESYQPKGG
ncbi:hypothetical protein [Phormidesmis priestleyi]|uniref:hypothetical protein n=1 Tax=Phormidesmis priestleyi TaxID=268141 RepID=UPI0009336E51|nr:hypothetical protein [Phormidesmis priestleyi]